MELHHGSLHSNSVFVVTTDPTLMICYGSVLPVSTWGIGIVTLSSTSSEHAFSLNN